MTDRELASEIVDKYWKVDSERFPNPYLLEEDIAQALTSRYKDGLRKAKEIAESWWEVNYQERYTKAAIKESIAQAIQQEIDKP